MDDDFWSAFGPARVMFWQCPIPEHQGRFPEPIRQTVRWEGDVAYCTTEGCGNSNANASVSAAPMTPEDTQ